MSDQAKAMARALLQKKLDSQIYEANQAGKRLSRLETGAGIARPFLRGATDLADGVLSLPKLAAALPVGALNLAGANIKSPLAFSVKDIAPGSGDALSARDENERTASTVIQGLGGVLGGLGIGGALGGTGGAILSANPGAQTAATLGSAAAFEGAKRSGAGPKTQTAAMLLGAMIPGSRGGAMSGKEKVAQEAAGVDLSAAIEAVKRWVQAGKPQHNWASGGDVAKAASKAANEATTITEPGIYWRGTNRVDEIDDVIRGVPIRSKNHVDGATEAGMSVSDSPATIWGYGYPYGYKVKGELVGRGSDGEPLLINASPVGKGLTKDEILAADRDRLLEIKRREAEIAAQAGIEPSLLRWLASRFDQ